ncbi:Uncharacterised protein [Halioglobus japonicus]|nr:Uncharacterised protein [Halioglobus japonicus]
MKKTVAVTLLGALLSLGANAKTLTIGIDLSGSNPLLRHENFAYMAAQYASHEINTLNNGDVVTVKTFGGREDVSNILSGSYTLSRRMKAKKIADEVAGFLQSLPAQTEQSQSSTNLLAWLEFGSGFDCNDDSRILVITDALESSSMLDGTSFLQGKQGLPKPDVDLTGCHITFWGLGAGFPHASVKFIRNEWRTWSETAGASFEAIIP